ASKLITLSPSGLFWIVSDEIRRMRDSIFGEGAGVGDIGPSSRTTGPGFFANAMPANRTATITNRADLRIDLLRAWCGCRCPVGVSAAGGGPPLRRAQPDTPHGTRTMSCLRLPTLPFVSLNCTVNNVDPD